MSKETTKQGVPDIKRIMECLPHRYPFLLVDRVLELDKEAKTLKAVKNVTFNELFFQGHFPGEPIMPGVLITEAIAQAGGILVYELGLRGLFVLSSLKNVKFRRMVTPGDVLQFDVEAIHVSKRGGRMKGVAKVEDDMAAEEEIQFALFPVKS